ncbi:MAG: DUF3307 domain-containing protein [Gammaproteobacteria bacterium]
MFWTLVLCHLLADYPLQTDAIVEAKKRMPGLLWHVAIHLLTMLVVVVGLVATDWRLAAPCVLAISACHFAIDYWKNILSALRPRWGIFIYVQDQALHLLSILGLSAWAEAGDVAFPSEPRWAIPALGYVLVTYTAFVTERVFYFHRDPRYCGWITLQSRTRMVSRAVLLSALFVGWNAWGLIVIIVGLAYHWWDLVGPYRFRALVTDAIVVAAVMSLCILAAR